MPIDLRTRAPAPSDCSVARKDFWILRGAVVVKSSLGMTGKPLKVVEAFVDIARVVFVTFETGRICFESWVKRESMYSLL